MKNTLALLMIFSLLTSCVSLPKDFYKYTPPAEPQDGYSFEFYSNNEALKIFNAEAAESLNKNLKNKVGTVKIRTHSIRHHAPMAEKFLWATPTVLSAFTSLLVGWPMARVIFETQMTADVADEEGEILKSFQSAERASCMIAMYYGYNEKDVFVCAFSKSYKRSLDALLEQINNDDELYQNLIKNQKEIRKNRVLKAKQEKQRQETKRKQQLDSLLKEIDSL